MGNIVALLTGLFAAYNSLSKEERAEIGELLGQIPDFAKKIVSGEEVDLSQLQPLMTSAQMDAAMERAEQERLSEGS